MKKLLKYSKQLIIITTILGILAILFLLYGVLVECGWRTLIVIILILAYELYKNMQIKTISEIVNKTFEYFSTIKDILEKHK